MINKLGYALEALEQLKKDSKILLNTVYDSISGSEDKLISNVYLLGNLYNRNVVSYILKEIINNESNKYYTENYLFKVVNQDGLYKLNYGTTIGYTYENSVIIHHDNEDFKNPHQKSLLGLGGLNVESYLKEYKLINKHKRVKTREKYIEEYGTDKLLIKVWYGIYFLVDKQILIISTSACKSLQETDQDILGEVAVWFDSIRNASKDKLKELIELDFNKILEPIIESRINTKIEDACIKIKSTINVKRQNAQYEIDRIYNNYTSLINKRDKYYSVRDNIRSGKLVRLLMKELIKPNYSHIIEKVDVDMAYSALDVSIPTVSVSIITKPLIQTYIDVKDLNLCKKNLARTSKHGEMLDKLANLDVDLVLYPLTVVLEISDLAYIDEKGLVNVFFKMPGNSELRYASQNHAFYNAVTGHYARGCLGGFAKPIHDVLSDIQTSQNEEDYGKLLKRLMAYIFQYLTTTNVTDLAGEQNLKHGMFADKDGNILYRMSYNYGENCRQKYTNIKDIEYGKGLLI